jgi:uncharacterized protein YbjT (DUF2867 family)
MRVAITGANGHLGMRLMRELSEQHEVIALVRSESAAKAIKDAYAGRVSCSLVDYTNAQDLATATQNAEVLVHLVGIIKESGNNSFYQAHEATSQALVDMVTAAQTKIDVDESASLQHIIYLSLLGVDKQSSNLCFASRARAEDILAKAPVSVSIIRVPMVLGEGDFASRSLTNRVKKKFCFILRGSCLEQPIYAGDVINALVSRLKFKSDRVGKGTEPGAGTNSQVTTLELAGPESLTRKQLTLRAAASKGGKPVIVSIPLFLINMLAWCFEKVSPNPPVTRAMLGVLDHDDNIDVKPALAQLEIDLTSLDETLSKVL